MFIDWKSSYYKHYHILQFVLQIKCHISKISLNDTLETIKLKIILISEF